MTHESGGTALDIPDALRLGWALDSVAIALALRGDERRHERLRQVGERLVDNASRTGSPDAVLVARKWAAELDRDRYVTAAHEQGVAIQVDYPVDIVDALAADELGQNALRSLHRGGLLIRAAEIRDGRGTPSDASAIWREVLAAWEEQAEDSEEFRVYDAGDLLAAAAAALVRAATAGESIEDEQLRRAVELLMDGARTVAQSAPPMEITDGSHQQGGRSGHVADMLWDWGSDRSISTGLALVLRARRSSSSSACRALPWSRRCGRSQSRRTTRRGRASRDGLLPT